MNASQVTSILRLFAAIVVAFATGKGWITQSISGDVGAAVVTLGLAVWGAFENTTANKAKSVASPDIKIVVGPGAPEALQTAAHDQTVPHITLSADDHRTQPYG